MLGNMNYAEARKLACSLSLLLVLEGKMGSKKALARLREALGDVRETVV